MQIASRLRARTDWRRACTRCLVVAVLASISALIVPGHSSAALTSSVRAGLEQVVVTHAAPGATVELIAPVGTVQATGLADSLGSYIFREVAPASGYTVRVGSQTSDPFEVRALDGSTPPQSFYDGQELTPGFNYIETRDGTTLSAWVYLPGPIEDGPYPTLVEYSGYDPSRPPSSGLDDFGIQLPPDIGDFLCSQISVLCELPSQPGSIFGGALGYAVVAVNIRGTGCSGGAFDFFEQLQRLDGYDVIETVAAQRWVAHGHVGMVGLSYPGISQLYVASTHPPHLASIAPFSVFDDVARGITAPGGMYNTGFAGAWIDQVLRAARPYGQGWERARVNGGDTICAQNQLLRHQNVDNTEIAEAQEFYDPELVDPLNPYLFVGDIDVPVLMAGAWQDEQTGGRFSTLWDRFDSAPFTRFIGYNGLHPDGYSPDILAELDAFLDFFVAEKRTAMNPILLAAMPLMMEQFLGAPVAPPAQHWLSGNFASLKERYMAQPQVRIIYDRGRSLFPGSPSGGYSVDYDSWPVPSAVVDWYLGPHGALSSDPPRNTTGSASFRVDTSEAAQAVRSDRDEWYPKPGWHWPYEDAGEALTFTSDRFDDYTALLGSGSVDLWIKSDAPDAYLEVTISEVDALGNEIYVQSGWLRAATRALAPEARVDWPQVSGLAQDAAPLVAGEWNPVRIEVFPFGHVFQTGSQLRLTIDNPGGSRPSWTFRTDPTLNDSTVEVAYNASYPSRLVLNQVGGLPEFLPFRSDCSYLRGQYCRPDRPFVNAVAEEAVFPPEPPPTPTTILPSNPVLPPTEVTSQPDVTTSPVDSSPTTRPLTTQTVTTRPLTTQTVTARPLTTQTVTTPFDQTAANAATESTHGRRSGALPTTRAASSGADTFAARMPSAMSESSVRVAEASREPARSDTAATLAGDLAFIPAADATNNGHAPIDENTRRAPIARTGGSVAILLLVAGLGLTLGAVVTRQARSDRSGQR